MKDENFAPDVGGGSEDYYFRNTSMKDDTTSAAMHVRKSHAFSAPLAHHAPTIITVAPARIPNTSLGILDD